MNKFYFGIVVLSIATFALLISGGEAVKCFVCSWAPSENQTDFCSEQNFQPENIKTFPKCKSGCEYVTKYDRNGLIVTFHRNCANAEVPTEKTCRNIPGTETSLKSCTCNSDLCNGAQSGSGKLYGTAMTSIVFVSWFLYGFYTYSF